MECQFCREILLMLIHMAGHLIWCTYSSAKLLSFSFVVQGEIDFYRVLTLIKGYRNWDLIIIIITTIYQVLTVCQKLSQAVLDNIFLHILLIQSPRRVRTLFFQFPRWGNSSPRTHLPIYVLFHDFKVLALFMLLLLLLLFFISFLSAPATFSLSFLPLSFQSFFPSFFIEINKSKVQWHRIAITK